MTVSRQLKTVAALGMLSSAVWASTFASFSDEATATSTFSAGTINILVGAETDDAYAFTTLSVSDLKPGDTKYAALPVNNAGSLAFTYDLATVATGDLAPELDLGIRTVVGPCDATTYAAALLSSVVPSSTAFDAADFSGRSLASSASEVLCFRVELPAATTNDAQADTASATMTFTATQLAGEVR